MAYYRAVSPLKLAKETIVSISHWNDKEIMPLPPYNGYQIITESGREFVLWNDYGQTCLNQIFRD